MLDWLLHPLVMYAFLLVSAGLNVWLLVQLKMDQTAAAATAERRERALEAALDEVRDQIAAIEKKASERPEPDETVLSVPEVPQGEINLTLRAQALRLSRRGESPEKIAAILGIPLNEVDLLLKVQDIITQTLQ
jgi:hypothetical protein